MDDQTQFPDQTQSPEPTARPSGGATTLPTRSALGVVVDGRYRIAQPLAAGGMGSVYLGEQDNLKRQVAIKLVRQPDPEDAERFRREAEALASVSHPAIVEVYDYLHEPEADVAYLVMAFIQGDNVADHAAEQDGGVLPALEAVELMLPVASALVELHAHGILHRDLKPANLVRYVRADGRAAVKLVDFGIARREQDAGLTADGYLVGTPPYLSAEVVLGKRHSEASDVYGFAATLFELVAGDPPHGKDDMHQIFKRIIREDVRLPPALQSTELGTLLSRLLVREPEQRPSMQAVLEELERIRLGMVQQTGDVAAMVEATRAMSRSSDAPEPQLRTDTPTVALKSTGSGATLSPASAPAPAPAPAPARAPATQPAPRPSPLPWVVTGVAVVVAVVVTLFFTLRSAPKSASTANKTAAAATGDSEPGSAMTKRRVSSRPMSTAMRPRRPAPRPMTAPAVATEVPAKDLAREKARCTGSRASYKMFTRAVFFYRMKQRLPWVKAVFAALLDCKHTSAGNRYWAAYRLALLNTRAGACQHAERRWKQHVAASRIIGKGPKRRTKCKQRP